MNLKESNYYTVKVIYTIIKCYIDTIFQKLMSVKVTMDVLRNVSTHLVVSNVHVIQGSGFYHQTSKHAYVSNGM